VTRAFGRAARARHRPLLAAMVAGALLGAVVTVIDIIINGD
jgi:hypothetical protein